jgi:ABC-type transporter Mla subunit MlaD
MAPTRKPDGELTAAADTLERELERHAALAAELQRESLDSEKSLRRAGRVLATLRDTEARLAELLAALVDAIAAARDRQQAQADAAAACAGRISERSDVLNALLQRWNTIGEEAAALTRLVQRGGDPGEGNGTPAPAATVDEVEQRLGRLADTCQELAGAALAGAFADLAKQADGLRQQLLAARHKIRLARKS